jgi:hypothetical protein
LKSFGEVGARWLWVDALLAIDIPIIRTEIESALPNCIVGDYLELNIELNLWRNYQ